MTITPLATFLCPPGYAGPRGLGALAREGSAVTEAARLVRRTAADRLTRRRTPYALRAPLHGVEPVVLVPGFMAGDTSLALMARHLRRLGYRTYRSTMHANVGCTQDASAALERRIEAIAIKRGRKVTIVGHSLGGLLARGLAARRPDLVEGIVTLGSPILAPGAAHPLLLLDLQIVVALRRAGVGTMMGEDCTSGECARLSWEQSQAPLPGSVAFTSVFSRRDGVVDWRSCLDPAARTVEVRTSHLGMALDPDVFDVVAETLARSRAARAASVARVSRSARWAAVPDVSAG
ncbi:MAG: lipase family alpha/beta hydrolase [Nocardioidaceae bacterium]